MQSQLENSTPPIPIKRKAGRPRITPPDNIFDGAFDEACLACAFDWRKIAAWFGVSHDTLQRWRERDDRFDILFQRIKTEDLKQMLAAARKKGLAGNASFWSRYVQAAHPEAVAQPTQVNISRTTNNIAVLPKPKETLVIDGETIEPPQIEDKSDIPLFKNFKPTGSIRSRGTR
jgi:hypothetical protein